MLSLQRGPDLVLPLSVQPEIETMIDFEVLRDTPPWEWPQSAGDTIMRVLRDRKSAASDRIDAADLAGNLVVMDDEVADILLAIVRSADESEELRGRAAISLGPVLEESDTDGFDDPYSEPSISEETFHKIQETFHKVYNDEGMPKEVRRRVLEASVRSPDEWHRDAIRDAYGRDDEDWRLTAVFCMQYVRGFDQQILGMLESPNLDIQYEAIRAAGNWSVSAAWPHVFAVLKSPKTPKRLRLAAIEAAGSIRPLEAKPTLVKLADSEDEEIAEAADEALLFAEPDIDDFDDEGDEDAPF
jgi:HEAT repeat protein